jgi:hypothetical protein
MIGISTLTQNAEGHLVIHEKKSSTINDHPARVSRTKLLDGGVYINHSGVSDGDRTLNVVARLSDADRTKLVNIHQTETFIHVACPDGYYEAAISGIRRQKADTVINILIKKKESE